MPPRALDGILGVSHDVRRRTALSQAGATTPARLGELVGAADVEPLTRDARHGIRRTLPTRLPQPPALYSGPSVPAVAATVVGSGRAK